MGRWIALVVLAACVAQPEPYDDDEEIEHSIVEQEDVDEVVSSKPGDEDDMAGILDLHNDLRRPLGLSDLIYDDELASISARWAQHLEEEEDCTLMHERGSPHGENLYWTSGKGRIERVVGAWAAEVEFYDYESNTCEEGKVCGHYKQLVWADTAHVGCAARRCASGPEIWMCSYLPPGNVVGQHPY